MARMTEDGSIVDGTGKVLFFSNQRFVDDICLGNCCFICGAQPDEKPFNNEHILPEWLLRRYDLFSRTISLPSDRTVRYDRYTVPCCVDCNSLMKAPPVGSGDRNRLISPRCRPRGCVYRF